MSDSNHLMDLLCHHCGQVSVCGPGEMARWLSNHGMLRREKNPEPELLVELFKSSAGSFRCPACNHTGMSADASVESDDEIWSAARKCEVCGQAIPLERLEIFPDTRICMVCKDGEERGVVDEEPQYCPKCGGLMALSPTRGAGVSRYEYRCTDCRR